MIQDYERSSSPGPQEEKKRVRVFEEFQPELRLELHLMVTQLRHTLWLDNVFFSSYFLLNKNIITRENGQIELWN